MENIKLWNHQRLAVDTFLELGSIALFHEIGTGKTITALTCLKELRIKKAEYFKVLIVAPLVTHGNWIREYSRIFPESKIKISNRTKDLGKEGFINIINYEKLIYKKYHDIILKNVPTFLICDESHYCKSVKTKRTKILHKIVNEMRDQQVLKGLPNHRIIMSGTPLSNNILDIHAQIYMIDYGLRLSKSYYQFRNAFTYHTHGYGASNIFKKYHIIDGAEEKVKKLIAPISLIAKKEDCVDLPPLSAFAIHFELNPDVRYFYETFKKEFVAYLKTEESIEKLDVSTLITQIIKLTQIANNFFYKNKEDGSREIVNFKNEADDNINNQKINWIVEMLQSFREKDKAIIWHMFEADRDMIVEKLRFYGIKYDVLESSKNLKTVENFKTNDSKAIIIPIALGIGFNLQEANYTIVYNKGYRMLHYEQAIGRNFRAGSNIHKRVYLYNLISRNTIEEDIHNAIMNKVDSLNAILGKQSTLYNTEFKTVMNQKKKTKSNSVLL